MIAGFMVMSLITVTKNLYKIKGFKGIPTTNNIYFHDKSVDLPDTNQVLSGMTIRYRFCMTLLMRRHQVRIIKAY